MKRAIGLSTGVFLALFLTSSNAHAQALRTWVSGVGDDANPCSRTAPCKTFPGAISKTAANGQMNVMDAGTYGAVSIFKSMTIDASENYAGVLPSSGFNGIIVNVGVNDIVVLRGLTLDGGAGGNNGIRILGSGTVHVENCVINNFTGKGIDFQPTGAARLFVKDTIIRNNLGVATGGGILVKPGVGGSATVVVDNVRMERNALFGLRAEDNSKVTVRNSVATGGGSNGFLAFSTSGVVELSIEDSAATYNATNGVKSEGNNAFVRISNMLITGNAMGLSAVSGGDILSFQNNRNDGNTANGAPTGNISEQ